MTIWGHSGSSILVPLESTKGNCGLVCDSSEDIANETSENRHNFVADSMGLCSFKFLWCAPKNVCNVRAHNGHSRSAKVVDCCAN